MYHFFNTHHTHTLGVGFSRRRKNILQTYNLICEKLLFSPVQISGWKGMSDVKDRVSSVSKLHRLTWLCNNSKEQTRSIRRFGIKFLSESVPWSISDLSLPLFPVSWKFYQKENVIYYSSPVREKWCQVPKSYFWKKFLNNVNLHSMFS